MNDVLIIEYILMFIFFQLHLNDYVIPFLKHGLPRANVVPIWLSCFNFKDNTWWRSIDNFQVLQRECVSVIE